MKMLRTALLFISTSSLRFLLFFGVTLSCFVIIFGNSNNIKNSIKASNGYDRFVDAIIAETIKSNQDNTTIPINDPEVQKLIKNAFPASLMEKSTENVIDGTYAWLNGQTKKPQYKIDFTDARQKLADDISAYAFNKLRAQPVCFAVPQNIDPFTAGCQPPYTDLNMEQLKLSAAISGDQGFLPNAVFTEQDLPKDEKGQRIYEKFSYAPTIYHWANYSTWILAAILLLLSITSVLLHRNRRRGVQQLGYALAGSGAALLLTPIFFSYILPRFSDSMQFSAAGSANSVQQVISDVTNDLVSNFYTTMINISIYIIVVGIIIITIEKFTRPSSAYLGLAKKAGLASSNPTKQPKSARNYKRDSIPIQSSEESKRRAPRKVKNKKYRKIPRKEI